MQYTDSVPFHRNFHTFASPNHRAMHPPAQATLHSLPSNQFLLFLSHDTSHKAVSVTHDIDCRFSASKGNSPRNQLPIGQHTNWAAAKSSIQGRETSSATFPKATATIPEGYVSNGDLHGSQNDVGRASLSSVSTEWEFSTTRFLPAS